MNLYSNVILNLKNIPGWKTRRKIVVFECDDWGGIRIPSAEVFSYLTNLGLNIAGNRYNKLDKLENEKDLTNLFSVLEKVKDKNNNPAIFTAVTNVANPDFDNIKASGFQKYYYETLPETYNRYGYGNNMIQIWKQGIESNLFVPELHGREHLAVQVWLRELKNGNKPLQAAFEKGFISLKTPYLKSPVREFRAAFYFDSDSHKEFLADSILDGKKIFNSIFGLDPLVFVPPNGIFHPDFERYVGEAGMKFLYTSNRMPYPEKDGDLKYVWRITGTKGPEGITYYTRNCVFEPTDINYKGISYTLKQIDAAFRWGKPAIISTHRVNFSGGIVETNRDKSLAELTSLLKKIVSIWPDTEFMSSREAYESIAK